MTGCRASLGNGSRLMERWERLLWRKSVLGPTRPTGEKNGRKRSLLVDARGVPLSIVASGANVHDIKLLEKTLDAVVVTRPEPDDENPQHLCADAGYVGKDARASVEARNYRPHIRPRNQEAEEKRQIEGYRARRWVVERGHSWLNNYRKLLVSFEKTEASYLALLYIAAALTAWRQTITIYG